MGSEDIWIIGSNMTKFGKHPDKDVIDLASAASVAALRDAEMTMSDIGVIGVGNLMNAGAGIGQQLQKQIGQTGIPVFNVSNACATGATALRVAIMVLDFLDRRVQNQNRKLGNQVVALEQLVQQKVE